MAQGMTGVSTGHLTFTLHQGEAAVKELLDADPSLVNEISTGGAQPLHMAGKGPSVAPSLDRTPSTLNPESLHTSAPRVGCRSLP